ncbi:MAG: hypothetical protein K6U80_10935 [Firmicutes bacterium]|nr:hypothetical protein [Bacillota bacterium]
MNTIRVYPKVLGTGISLSHIELPRFKNEYLSGDCICPGCGKNPVFIVSGGIGLRCFGYQYFLYPIIPG